MSKQIAEQSNRLSIFWLKKNGYLHKDYSQMSGGIKWTNYSDKGNSISFSVRRDNWGTVEEQTYINLNYTHTDYWNEEKSNMDYKIYFATTSPNYGGKRYWFVCPLYKRGQFCGRRVGVLFSIGKWFGCRHCGEIAYSKQMEGGKYRGLVSIPDVDKAEKDVKRFYYRGKPTKNYRRLMRLNEKFEKGLLGAYLHLKKLHD